MPSNSWWESLALKKMSCCTVESLKFHSFQPQLCHHLPCPNLYLCECQNMCSKSLNESNRADQVVVDMVERKKKQHSTIYPLRQVETVSYKPYHLMIQMAISTDTFYKQKWNHTLGTYIYKFNKSLTYLLLTFPTLFYYYFFFQAWYFFFQGVEKINVEHDQNMISQEIDDSLQEWSWKEGVKRSGNTRSYRLTFENQPLSCSEQGVFEWGKKTKTKNPTLRFSWYLNIKFLPRRSFCTVSLQWNYCNHKSSHVPKA